jgi:hypothetical protein
VPDIGAINFLPGKVPEPVLAGIELQVTDRERVLQAARTRDCINADGEVDVCGVRFRLS